MFGDVFKRPDPYRDVLDSMRWRYLGPQATVNNAASRDSISSTSSSSSSASRSTQTVVRDGQVIEVTEECKDGKCKTWKTAKKLDGSSRDEVPTASRAAPS